MRHVPMLLLAFACDGGKATIDGLDYEGDVAGECTDGADNDRDGDFDCDDDGCTGAPECGGSPSDTDDPEADSDVDPSDRTETFPGGVSDKVDVLWVIDDSCSMAEEQSRLSTAGVALLETLAGTSVDWHVGLVTTDTTDPDRNGKLIGYSGHTYLDDATSGAASVFAGMVQIGTGGSAEERGLLAASRAITQPTPAHQERNLGFHRPDASLHIVVMSDEDDQSKPAITSEDFTAWLLAEPSLPGLVTELSAIVGLPPSGCHSATGDAIVGANYLEVVESTGGLSESICKTDWAPFLSQLGELTLQGRPSITLAATPAPGSLHLTVTLHDHVWTGRPEGDAAACDPETCFRYALAGTMVTFVDGWRPRIEATIEATYRVR